MRRSLGESLLFSALLIAVFMIPGFISDFEPIQQICIKLIVSVLFCAYLFYNLHRQGAFSKRNQEPKWKNLLILSPFLIPVLFLGIVALIGIYNPLYYMYGDGLTYLFLQLLSVILTALMEEMFFRMYIFQFLQNKHPVIRILMSAGAYALFEILYILQNTSITAVLMLMLGSFLLGIVLGAIREYGHCIYFCMAFNFVISLVFIHVGMYFTLFELIFTGQNFLGIWAYLLNPILWLLFDIAYLTIVYLLYFKKKEINY